MLKFNKITLNSTLLDRYSTYLRKILDGKESDPRFHKLSLETCNVAKFLCQFNPEIEIIEKPKYPDFIIKQGDKIIGLEHEILVDPLLKKIEGSLSDLITSAEKEFKAKYPNEKKLLNIYFNPGFKYKKPDKPQIVKEILSIIEAFLSSNELIENKYFEDISMMNHSGLNFVCNLGGWWQRPLNSVELEKAIRKKEEKLSEYIKSSKTNEQWLLIVIGSLGESSYEVETTDFLPYHIESKFDKVFLLEDFNSTLYQVK